MRNETWTHNAILRKKRGTQIGWKSAFDFACALKKGFSRKNPETSLKDKVLIL